MLIFVFSLGHEVFNDYMEYMTELQLRLQNVSGLLDLSWQVFPTSTMKLT